MRYVVIAANIDKNKIATVDMARNLYYDDTHISEGLPKYFTIAVTWDRETYEWCCANELKQSPYIIIREVLVALTGAKDVTQVFKLNSALKNFNVEFDPTTLKDEKLCVKYLAELFKNVYHYYLIDERKNYYGKFFTSVNSLILHNEKCYYAKRIKNKVPVERSKMFEGYLPCKHCLLKKYFSKQKRFNLKGDYITELENYCSEYNLKCSIENGIAIVRSKMSSWKIYCKGQRIMSVFHSDYKYNNIRNDLEYHRENIQTKTLHRIIIYIALHDGKWRRKKCGI